MHICLSLRSFLIVYEEAHESEAQHSESSGSRILFCSEIASFLFIFTHNNVIFRILVCFVVVRNRGASTT